MNFVLGDSAMFDGIDFLADVPRLSSRQSDGDVPDAEAKEHELDRHVTLCVNDARRKQLYFSLNHGSISLPDEDAAERRWIEMDIDYPEHIVERVNAALAEHGERDGVSYVVDVYRGKYKPERNFFKLALFLSFFPQMTEGPIGKYEIMMPRLVEGHSFDFERDAQAVMRIFWGMFKKMVIADRANLFVTGVFDNGDQAGSMVLLGTLLYTVQIYCEFSGCMDIVCATGQLFGVEMQENFRRPIFSKTINEFWQRWHITLGAWIKEYVFFSVSLSKGLMNLSKHTRKKLNDYFANLVPMTFALFCVWFFNGIWHGASWKYVLYGLYYYILMMIGMYLRPVSDKLLHALHIAPESKGFALFQMVRTFLIVNVGMMLFRCHTISQWGQSLARIFTDFDGACLTNGTVLSLGNDWQDFLIMGIGVLVVGIVEVLQEKGHTIRLELARRPVVLRYAVFLALVIGVIVFGAYGTGYETVAPIYGQF